jgi:hypothetical protein
VQVVDVGPADRIDQADGKAMRFLAANASGALLEAAFAAQGIVDRRAGPSRLKLK